MPIITLLTDLGTADWYVGTLKGQLMRMMPGWKLWTFRTTYPNLTCPRRGLSCVIRIRDSFPRVRYTSSSVDSSVSTFDKPFVAIRFADQYFIGTDNGVFSLAFGHKPLQSRRDHQRSVTADWQSSLFQARDIFSKDFAFTVGTRHAH